MFCPFCGGESEKNGRPCARQECQEASARVPLAEASSRGYPLIRKGRGWQTEEDRVRKQAKLRLLPDCYARIRCAASREGITVSDLVERWALTLAADDA